jgi:signal peptidase II
VKKPLIVGIILLALDQLTKYIVGTFVSFGSVLNVVSQFNFFNVTNVRNTGTAFSMFQGRNISFSIAIFFVLSVLSFWLYKNWRKIGRMQQYSFCLIIAGGLGNLIDRLFRGAVVDFLDFGISSLRWPSFNIADSCICIAVCLIFSDMFLFGKKKQV